MARVLTDKTIRQRDIRVELGWSDIRHLLELAAFDATGLRDGTAGVSFEVKVEQIEEGSPSYKTGRWRALVDVTIAEA